MPSYHKVFVERGASIALISHLGRPIEGKFEEKYSLRPVAEVLSNLLETKIGFETNWINGLDWGETRITLCENVRFLKGEIPIVLIYRRGLLHYVTFMSTMLLLPRIAPMPPPPERYH